MHAILVHGWRGWPENAWFPWLRKRLEIRRWTTEAPKFPNPLVPERDAWVAKLERVVQRAIVKGIPPSKIVLIGHSLGCATILLMLERYQGKPFGKVALVSGFGRDFGTPGIKKWLDHPLDFIEIRTKAKDWRVLHGKGDIFVPPAEGRWLAKQLKATLTMTVWPGHFMHEEGAKELPEVLYAVV